MQLLYRMCLSYLLLASYITGNVSKGRTWGRDRSKCTKKPLKNNVFIWSHLLEKRLSTNYTEVSWNRRVYIQKATKWYLYVGCITSLFVSMETTTDTFLLTMNKSLHDVLKKIYSLDLQSKNHIAVTTVETHHSPSHGAHIHSFVSINVQQALMHIKEFSFS